MNEESESQFLMQDPRLLRSEKGSPDLGELCNMKVSQNYYSREIAGKFAIGGAWGSVGGSGNEKDFAIRYEALLETKGVNLPPLGGGEIYEEVYVVGVTLDISVATSESQVHFDVFSVAAAVQLQMAKASYTTSVYPADSAVLRALLPKEGTMDPANYEMIIGGIRAAKDAIASEPTLTPQPYYRPRKLARSVDAELGMAQCVAFSVRYLSKGKHVETASEDAVDAGLDGTLVRLVYGYLWPEVKNGAVPPSDVKAQASRWLVDVGLDLPHT